MDEVKGLLRHIKAVPVLVLCVSALAIVSIVVLQSRSDAMRRAQAELGQMSTQLTESDSSPLGLMFGGSVAAAQQRMIGLQGQINSNLRQLQANTPVPGLTEVRRALAASFASSQVTTELIAQVATPAGRAALAQALTGDDPRFTQMLSQLQTSGKRVADALGAAANQYAGRAQTAERQATIGSAGAILLLLLAFALAYRRLMRARADAERLAAQNAEMAGASRREALTDALTRLGNRRALVADLESALHDDPQPLALVLCDLDGFKQYNDTFGHPAGDALLRRLGERLTERLPEHAAAYRMGGDEFCVLARVDHTDGAAIARLAAEALSESGEAFSIGCSFGIVLAPSEATTAEGALGIADERMYAQKAAGKRASVTREATDALLQVLVERDEGLAEHAQGVAQLAAETAERLGMSAFEIRQVHVAAQLHDVGKSAIPDSILNKAAALEPAEWRFIQRHTVIGERIVRAAPSISHAASLIRSSHERVDGTGYPDHLPEAEIPLGARIIAVCDAFDAMISDRPYRPAIPVAEALAELRRCAGSQFDARVVTVFCQLAEAGLGAVQTA